MSWTISVLVNFIHLANIRRPSISLCLRCCIIDKLAYGFKWRSNLKVLCTLQVTLKSLKTFLTSCLVSGSYGPWSAFIGMPGVLYGSCFLKSSYNSKDMLLTELFQPREFFFHNSHYFNWRPCCIVLQYIFTTADACSLLKFILNKIQLTKEIWCNFLTS